MSKKGLDLLERVWKRSKLTEDEAMALAVSEQRALRAEKCAAHRPEPSRG